MRLLIAAMLSSAVGVAQAEAVKVSPQLTVFGSDRAASGAKPPTVLRGSATRRGTAYGGRGYERDLGPLPVGAGDTLWLTDPETGAIFACEPRRTSRVGDRYIHCFD